MVIVGKAILYKYLAQVIYNQDRSELIRSLPQEDLYIGAFFKDLPIELQVRVTSLTSDLSFNEQESGKMAYKYL